MVGEFHSLMLEYLSDSHTRFEERVAQDAEDWIAFSGSDEETNLGCTRTAARSSSLCMGRGDVASSPGWDRRGICGARESLVFRKR